MAAPLMTTPGDAIAGDRIVKEKGWKPLGEAGLAQTDSVAGVRDTMGAATRGELSSLLQKEPMELAMKCNDLSRSLVAFD